MFSAGLVYPGAGLLSDGEAEKCLQNPGRPGVDKSVVATAGTFSCRKTAHFSFIEIPGSGMVGQFPWLI